MTSQSIVIFAFYKFVTLEKHSKLKRPLLEFCKHNNIKGTVLLAKEGLNGTVSGPREGIDALKQYFLDNQQINGVQGKESYYHEHPFYRMKVKIKEEIVTLHQDGVDPNETVGTYIKPKDWNAIIQDPEVILVDTRNTYEYDVGTFKGALNPETTNFVQFPEYVAEKLNKDKHKKVAMFCTGGIRCEKASSFMLKQGFEEVYHLEGGILKYLEEVDPSESLWEGECFVFDNRVTVNHQLEKGSYDMCHACRHPVSEADKRTDKYIKDVACPHCYDAQSEHNRQRAMERAKQMELAEKRGAKHIGEMEETQPHCSNA